MLLIKRETQARMGTLDEIFFEFTDNMGAGVPSGNITTPQDYQRLWSQLKETDEKAQKKVRSYKKKGLASLKKVISGFEKEKREAIASVKNRMDKINAEKNKEVSAIKTALNKVLDKRRLELERKGGEFPHVDYERFKQNSAREPYRQIKVIQRKAATKLAPLDKKRLKLEQDFDKEHAPKIKEARDEFNKTLEIMEKKLIFPSVNLDMKQGKDALVSNVEQMAKILARHPDSRPLAEGMQLWLKRKRSRGGSGKEKYDSAMEQLKIMLRFVSDFKEAAADSSNLRRMAEFIKKLDKHELRLLGFVSEGRSPFNLVFMQPDGKPIPIEGKEGKYKHKHIYDRFAETVAALHEDVQYRIKDDMKEGKVIDALFETYNLYSREFLIPLSRRKKIRARALAAREGMDLDAARKRFENKPHLLAVLRAQISEAKKDLKEGHITEEQYKERVDAIVNELMQYDKGEHEKKLEEHIGRLQELIDEQKGENDE